jgi:hypothetical protein
MLHGDSSRVGWDRSSVSRRFRLTGACRQSRADGEISQCAARGVEVRAEHKQRIYEWAANPGRFKRASSDELMPV